MNNIGIGISDFREIFEKDIFYIDKTFFLKEWIDNKDKITLITRPRRFGKTLTMSMAECFLSDSCKKYRYLFEDLYIGNCENSDMYMSLQGSAPVIFLSFAGLKGENFENTFREIESRMAQIYLKYKYILDSDCLTCEEKEYYLKITSQRGDVVDLARAINNLSCYLEKYSNKKVYILLDEYDTPMQNAYVKGYWEELVSFMMTFFTNTFKNNEALDRAIITGITRVSKESIFSDFNNLEVITITSNKYASSFGFTEEEVSWALDDYNLSDEKENVKKYYNGFVMGNGVAIYNPWSIINFLSKKKYADYWANTSSNRLINDVISKASPQIKLDMEHLLRGGAIYSELKEDIVFSDLETTPDTSIWSLMVASGYMRVCKCENYVYELQLTNMEVISMFQKMFKDWFSIKRYEYSAFITALLSGDVIDMEETLNELALAMFSMFDTANGDSRRAPENFYHGFVLGMLVDLKDRFVIESNRESGLGRYDIIMIPKDINKDVGCIIEFKVFSPRKDKDIQAAVTNALRQIEEMKYEQVLKQHNVKKIYKYGIVFKGKQCVVGIGE